MPESIFANLHIVLDRLRFPENAGMAARACANMGASALCLSRPRNWDPLKASPLATACGRPVLNSIKIYPCLHEALMDCHSIYGTSARTGGWRVNAEQPAVICVKIAESLARNEKVALLFGPEDSGLDNHALALCSGIIHIDTAPDASSLNIAQALLLVLYELRRQCVGRSRSSCSLKLASFADQLLLEEKLKNILIRLDCLTGKNHDFAFRQWHDLLVRKGLQSHEYAALMGLCRQLENRLNIPAREKEN